MSKHELRIEPSSCAWKADSLPLVHIRDVFLGKKQIISHNIHNFLEVNLLVLFFNYNHISIEEWRIIKSELAKIEKVSTLQ